MPPANAILSSADVTALYGWFIDMNYNAQFWLDEMGDRASAEDIDFFERMLHWSHSMANVIAPF